MMFASVSPCLLTKDKRAVLTRRFEISSVSKLASKRGANDRDPSSFVHEKVILVAHHWCIRTGAGSGRMVKV